MESVVIKGLTWKPILETKLTWRHDKLVGNTDHLRNVMIKLVASILYRKLSFELRNVAFHLETSLFSLKLKPCLGNQSVIEVQKLFPNQ